jgi:crossover junction endodeoxyribonuclease RusA
MLTTTLPPSINHVYFHVGHQKIIKPEAKAYREHVGWMVRQAKIPKLEGRVHIIMRVWQKTRRNVDLDNLAKFFLDSLQAAGVFENDSQIDHLEIIRSGIDPAGRCETLIAEIK